MVVGSGDAKRIGTGTYRLMLARIPGPFVVPTGDEGGPLTNGANHAGVIPVGDLDLWTFQATAGESVALSTSKLTNQGGFTPWIRVVSPTGVLRASSYDVDVAQVELLSLTTAGTYTVLIASGDPSRTGNGTYQLTLAKSPEPFVVPLGDEGGVLINGENHLGAIHRGDLDSWSFQANAGDPISLSVSIPICFEHRRAGHTPS